MDNNVSIIPQFVYINSAALLENVNNFENGQIIFCNENKYIYLKMNDAISRYSSDGTNIIVVDKLPTPEIKERQTAIINSEEGTIESRGYDYLSFIKNNEIDRSTSPLYIKFVNEVVSDSPTTIIDSETGQIKKKGNSLSIIVYEGGSSRPINPFYSVLVYDPKESYDKTADIDFDNNEIKEHSTNNFTIFDGDEIIYGENKFFARIIN